MVNDLKLLNRRQILRSGGLLAASSLFLPKFAWAQATSAVKSKEKVLHLYQVNTGEFFKGPYWAEGAYIDEQLKQLNHVLRDWRTGETIEMNQDLLDLLHALAEQYDSAKPIEVICGYRSKKTNERLRRMKRGVAKHSRHITGHAVDFRIPGVRLSEVRKAALAQKAGGVGYYPRSDFVHVDIRNRLARW